MKTIIIDCNIYDELEKDAFTRTRIFDFVKNGTIRIIVTPKVQDELAESHFAGIPSWFPVCLKSEAVFILDHGHLDQAVLGEVRSTSNI